MMQQAGSVQQYDFKHSEPSLPEFWRDEAHSDESICISAMAHGNNSPAPVLVSGEWCEFSEVEQTLHRFKCVRGMIPRNAAGAGGSEESVDFFSVYGCAPNS
jgi:hypothetical protein